MTRKSAKTALAAIMALAAILAFAVSLGVAAMTIPQRDLDGDSVPPAAFDNVIDTVGRNLAPLHRYVALRQKVLGLDPIRAWDLFVPVVKNIDLVVSYPQAKEMALAGLAPLGAEYRALVAAGFVSDWTASDAHPYIQLSYRDAVDSLLTVAHESGHAIHLDQSSRSLPYLNANHAIFVGEVASATNEALMLEYLLQKETDRNNRLFILNKYLEKIRRTIYNQSLSAELEKTAYRSFDVYRSVAGLAAGTVLAEKIATEGQPAVDRYFAFLRAGGSDHPLDALRAAGVDMTSPAPLEATLKLFEHLLTEMEYLLAE